MEIIKVYIQPDGNTAKEVNPMGQQPSPSIFLKNKRGVNPEYKKWLLVEDSLKTFEIEEVVISMNGKTAKFSEIDKAGYGLLPDSEHEALILNNGKIRIL